MTEATVPSGLPNSLFAAQLLDGKTLIGTGRAISGGGDTSASHVRVQPAEKGRGLGKCVMSEINAWLEQKRPTSAS